MKPISVWWASPSRVIPANAGRAMDFLQRAVAEGWQNPEVLKTDPDIDPLRARQDYRKLLADLEAKTKE
jgi:hypothetical protein